jgi:hypothetical protein
MAIAFFESSYGTDPCPIVISFSGVAPQLQLHTRHLTELVLVFGQSHATAKRRSVAPANRPSPMVFLAWNYRVS